MAGIEKIVLRVGSEEEAQHEIARLRRDGFRIVDQTKTRVMLEKNVRPSILISSLLFALFILPALIYRIAARRTIEVTLELPASPSLLDAVEVELPS